MDVLEADTGSRTDHILEGCHLRLDRPPPIVRERLGGKKVDRFKLH